MYIFRIDNSHVITLIHLKTSKHVVNTDLEGDVSFF